MDRGLREQPSVCTAGTGSSVVCSKDVSGTAAGTKLSCAMMTGRHLTLGLRPAVRYHLHRSYVPAWGWRLHEASITKDEYLHILAYHVVNTSYGGSLESFIKHYQN